MDIVFVRHGQAEHTLSPPQSLYISDPCLTELGKMQSIKLREALPLLTEDIIIISPTRRTIQTAMNWASNVNCQMIVHPLVGPRMFPLLSSDKAYSCDDTLSRNTIQSQYHHLQIIDLPNSAWTKGINAIEDGEFSILAQRFLEWCRQLNKSMIYIVSHDGTITSYRAHLGESVTRSDFLGETGFYRVRI